ncbi:hypothetical protein D3C80_1039150 [compost metagenome]
MGGLGSSRGGRNLDACRRLCRRRCSRGLAGFFRNGDQAARLAGLRHHGEKLAVLVGGHGNRCDLFRREDLAVLARCLEHDLMVAGGQRLVQHGGKITARADIDLGDDGSAVGDLEGGIRCRMAGDNCGAVRLDAKHIECRRIGGGSLRRSGGCRRIGRGRGWRCRLRFDLRCLLRLVTLGNGILDRIAGSIDRGCDWLAFLVNPRHDNEDHQQRSNCKYNQCEPAGTVLHRLLPHRA